MDHAVICPYCAAGDISPDSGRCPKCGYSPGGVTAQLSARDDLEEWVHAELASEFEIGAELARGPHSAVYVARRASPEVTLALRVLSRAPIEEARLADQWWRAMAAVNALEHPNIVPIYRFGTTQNLAWYATRFAGGQSLADLVREQGPLPVARAVRVVVQVAIALDEAHRRGVVHGDLSPGNIIIRDDGDTALVTELAVGPILDQIPAFGGKARSAEYEAPECGPGLEPGPRADQFALAVTFREVVETPASLPPSIERVVNRALAPVPRDRFLTILDFARALTAALDGQVQPMATPLRHQPPAREAPVVVFPPYTPDEDGPGRRRWSVLATLVVGALGIGLILAVRFLASDGAPELVPPGPEPEPVPIAAADSMTATPDTVALAIEPDLRPTPSASAAVTAPAATEPSPAAPRAPAPQPAPPRPPSARPTGESTAAGRTAQPAVPPGRLFVSSRPWGELYLDDRLVGNTPQANVPVAPGAHRVRIVREGFKPFEREVVLISGQELRLIDVVLEPGG